MSAAGLKQGLKVSTLERLARSRRGAVLLAAATVTLVSVAAYGQSLPAGIYVEQVGDGTTPGDSSADQPLFIDSIAPAGSSLSTTIALPTANNGSIHAMTGIADEGGAGSGTGFAENIMQATPDGRYLITGGWDLASGAATNQKTIALIDSFTGNVNTGSYTAATSAGPRSVESVDGGKHIYYDGSASGLRYVTPPSSFSTPNAAIQRTVQVADGQLFESGSATTGGGSTGGPGISVVGNGAQGSTGVSQTYVITTGTNPEQFVMLDQNPNVGFLNNVNSNNFQTNLDLCYVATNNGVEKYVYDGTTWNKTETLTPASSTDPKLTQELVGLTYGGKDDNGNNVLYATTAGDFGQSGADTSQEGNALERLVDTGPSAQWQVIQESATNEWLRGVAAIDEPGDTNGDFHINSSDFAVIAANYGETGVTGGYSVGDFNYDGTVNALDFNILATNYGYDPNAALDAADVPAGALGAMVPEPIGLSVLLLGGLAMGRRRGAARRLHV